MTLWPDIGPYVGPTPNCNAGGMVEHRGLVLHIASGFYEGTISWQSHSHGANSTSSHFIVARDGRCVQMVDTADAAWAERAGNAHWLSVELEGFAPEDSLHATHQGWETATPQQVEVCARILAKMHAVYGVPLQLASSPSGQGLGHHSMGAESGVDWGHSLCPGVAIKAQKPAILARAIAIAAGTTTTTQETFMALTDEQQHDLWVWVASLVDPNTPKGGRPDDRFHFPPALVELNAKVDALAAKLDALGTPAPAVVDSSALTAAVQHAVNAVKGSITFGA
jgi:hypothetical protein